MGAIGLLAGVGAMAGGVLIDSVSSAVNNYLSSSPSGSAPQIPLGRNKGSKQSPKVAKKQGLAQYSDAINGGLAGVFGAVLAGSSAISSLAETASSTNKTELDELKSLNPDSPLLQNQLHLKQSINDIVDAINSNTIASATFLAPISSNLSAISSTLIAISSTLLEISDTYSGEIEKADDLPYLDSQTFYDLLSGDPDVSQFALAQIRVAESDLISRLSAEGRSFAEIKSAITEFRKANVPAKNLIDVTNATSGLTQQSPVSSLRTDGSPATSTSPSSLNVTFPDKMNVTLQPEMIDSALSSKALNDFKMAPAQIFDLDGNPAAYYSPAQISAVANATKARTSTDTNSQEFDYTDFPSMLGLPVLPFSGRSTILQKDPLDPSPIYSKILGL